MTDQTPAVNGDGEDLEIDFLTTAAEHQTRTDNPMARPVRADQLRRDDAITVNGRTETVQHTTTNGLLYTTVSTDYAQHTVKPDHTYPTNRAKPTIGEALGDIARAVKPTN